MAKLADGAAAQMALLLAQHCRGVKPRSHLEAIGLLTGVTGNSFLVVIARPERIRVRTNV